MAVAEEGLVELRALTSPQWHAVETEDPALGLVCPIHDGGTVRADLEIQYFPTREELPGIEPGGGPAVDGRAEDFGKNDGLYGDN